ncbi:MAG: hypothetical protein IJ012_02905 [Clostridia bacterium]|nr:hypothetical protein [Clostridia bacterium]
MDWPAIVLFFGIPLLLLVLYAVCIFRYVRAKRANRLVIGAYSDVEVRKRRNAVVVLSVVIGVMLAAVVGFVLLLYMAIAFM